MDIVPAELIEVAEPKKRPWGLWQTLGFSFLILAVFVVLQTVVVVVFAVVAPVLRDGSPTDIEKLTSNGLCLSLATWSSVPFCLGLVVLFVKLRRPWTVKEYLALRRVSVPQLAGWCLLIALFIGTTEALSLWWDLPLDSSFLFEARQTAFWLPLLWMTLLIAAPAFEEIFFRGFMFRGIQESRLGGLGATILTALVWSLIHVQYNPYIITVIFTGGILFGIARWISGSVYLTMAMHFTWNLISIVETECYLRWHQ